MTFGSKFGRKSVTWKVNTQGRKYFKLSELIEQHEIEHVYIIDCLYINEKSQYGLAPVYLPPELYADVFAMGLVDLFGTASYGATVIIVGVGKLYLL